jgi:hypothetical protein
MSARARLRELLSLAPRYPAGPEKVRAIERLRTAGLASADDVSALHETLLFLRAHPDDPAVLDATEAALSGFARRPDVRRLKRSLADTGIAGTTMQYTYSWPMAAWLARRQPRDTSIVWEDWSEADLLDELLVALGAPAEMPGVDDETMSGAEWLSNARPEGVGDFATLLDRIANVTAAPAVREHLFNRLAVPAIRNLGDGPDSRTLARGPAGEPYFHTDGIRRERPDLAAAAEEPVRIRKVDQKTADALVDLSRACMSVRLRELEAFDYAYAADTWLADAGRGLLVSVMGMRPERRLMPEALYSGLFLKDGVPVGYWLASALFGTAEIAYNIFPTFRGGEAGWIYSRLLALVHQFLGATSVTVPRYQIGFGNDEAIGSGAFWFYRKLGFEPLDPDVAKLLAKEESRLRKDPSHRSSAAVLRKLTVENLVFHLGEPREDLVGVFPYVNTGHAATRTFARYGGKSRTAIRQITSDAAELLGVRHPERLSVGERRGFEAWAPVVLAMPEVRRWVPKTRRSLARVFMAKGAPSESEFVRAAAEHAPFRRALGRLCLSWEEEKA